MMPATSVSPSVETGQVWQLGRHRLMCGDATSKADVATLFACERPTLVVTSPPYAKQRDYDRPIACWDSMMMGALDGHDFAEDVQMLINLGPLRKKSESIHYWHAWVALMRAECWSFCGQYVWDKMTPQAGQNHGFCYYEHEYILHFRKRKVLLNKTVRNKSAGRSFTGGNYRGANGLKREPKAGVVQHHRPPGSFFRCYPNKHNKTGHPAVFPIALPSQLIASWQKPGCITYDPFCGAGTTLLAAEQENVTGLGMEISPAYCAMAIARWNKQHGVTAAYLLGGAPPPRKLTSPLQLALSQPELGHEQPSYFTIQ
ncbi:MAG: site-specific DNA-methyltransferase [Cytophagaceae bacterium]|nr:MAG: site-specific DNA-methyltransferase [Cytophagaceae bacterium]